jgi:hypothetical protein
MNPSEFYQSRIAELQNELNRLKIKNRFITFGRLLLMGLFLYFIYKWLSANEIAYMWGAFMWIALFVALYRYDLIFDKHYRITKNLLSINQNELKALAGQYEAFDAGKEFLDPNHHYCFDLDLFVDSGLFQSINRTVTAEGKQLLAQRMLMTDVTVNEVVSRQDAVKLLTDLPLWRQQYTAIGQLEKLSLASFVNHFSTAEKVPFKSWKKWLIYSLIAASVIAIGGNILGWWSYHVWLILYVVNLFVVGSYGKSVAAIYSKISGGAKIIGRYNDLLIHLKKENKLLNDSRLEKAVSILANDENSCLKAFYHLEKLLSRFDQRTNILVTFITNFVFLNDVLLVMRYNRWMDVYASKLSEYESAIAEIDALISLANFAYNNPSFVVPALNEEVIVDATQLGHPLIADSVRVCNDFKVQQIREFYITTGANMAGKSTFLRTVGINMVLASCGAPVCAHSYVFTPVKLFSSMRTSDNLVNNTSYFQAELLRLKALIDLAAQGDKLFVILDEILKGTNSKDKLAGSRLFLLKMLTYNCAGVIATHDLALGELEAEYPGHFHNICFEITIHDNDITYDYRLQNGVAHNLNATWLLDRLLQG